MINIEKRDQIKQEVIQARAEGNVSVTSNVYVRFADFENYYLRNYFESFGIRVYALHGATDEGCYYHLDWTLTNLDEVQF